jgi:hypothetical protein
LFFELFLIGVVTLTSCGVVTPPTPTIDTNAIITQVGLTVEAGLAMTEAAKPSITPTNTPKPSPTNTVTPMISPTPFTINTPTYQVPLPGSTSSPDKLKYIADITLPDGTEVGAGDILDKTWEIQNIGTSYWNTKYRLYYCAGLPVALVKNTLPKLFVNLSGEVDPSEKVQITVSIVAPQTSGFYRIYFQLLNESGNKVIDEQGNGCGLWADFKVK